VNFCYDASAYNQLKEFMKKIAGFLFIAFLALLSACGGDAGGGESANFETGRSATLQEIDDLRNSI
jgi:hypothetical protein